MIKIFDTTLRDGEQAPGFSMNLREKLMMAKQLEKLGVDVVEVGFPAASPDDFRAVSEIAELLEKPEVCALCRCHEGDIEAGIKALQRAKKPRIHVFLATSDIHLQYKLKISREEAIRKAVMGVKLARQFAERVDFSPEDGTRSDRKFLVEILTEVIRAGADTINIPDTVGYSTPEEFGDLIRFLNETVPGMKRMIIATHCHNDLGLAVANSLAGIRNGAGQIECTINGIGERAGNASLEEVVMAIKTRPDLFPAGTGIDTRQLASASRLLSSITGQPVQVNKAIVGKNAFAHEAGIHQHGILSNPLTYEIMKPEDVGVTGTELVLGKHSGRNALADRLKKLGIAADKEKMETIFIKFKALADKKKSIYDEDLIMIATDAGERQKYELVTAKIVSEKDRGAKAEVAIRVGDEKKRVSADDDGPVAALYSAITQATGFQGILVQFNVSALTPDSEAVGVVNIEWKDEKGRLWRGQGSDTDTMIAAGKALIDVLNRREVRTAYENKPS